MRLESSPVTVGQISKKRPLLILSPADTVSKAANLMGVYKTGVAAVVEGGALIGILTERDIIKRAIGPGSDLARTQVGKAMAPDPMTIDVACSVTDALDLLTRTDSRYLLAMDGHKLAGILSIRDLYAEVQRLIWHTIDMDDSLFGLLDRTAPCEAFKKACTSLS